MKIVTFTCLCLFFSLSSRSQTLHALLFVNEEETGREVDRRADLSNMDAFFQDIALNLGYTYHRSVNSGQEFTAAEVKREVKRLYVDKDDIVVFYYSGHGYNEGTDVWPTLNFADENYWFSSILKNLNAQTGKAKLILCIADCCNKGLNNAPVPSYTFNPVSSANMKALFTGFKGQKTVLMSASKQGQYSWSDKVKGALFGISLRTALYSHTDNSSLAPSWEAIYQEARTLTLKASEYKQEPQMQVIQPASVIED